MHFLFFRLFIISGAHDPIHLLVRWFQPRSHGLFLHPIEGKGHGNEVAFVLLLFRSSLLLFAVCWSIRSLLFFNFLCSFIRSFFCSFVLPVYLSVCLSVFVSVGLSVLVWFVLSFVCSILIMILVKLFAGLGILCTGTTRIVLMVVHKLCRDQSAILPPTPKVVTRLQKRNSDSSITVWPFKFSSVFFPSYVCQ